MYHVSVLGSMWSGSSMNQWTNSCCAAGGMRHRITARPLVRSKILALGEGCSMKVLVETGGLGHPPIGVVALQDERCMRVPGAAPNSWHRL